MDNPPRLSPPTAPLSQLKPMADPYWKGKHILHENRFVVTADTEVELTPTDTDPTKWRLIRGSIIATLTDTQRQEEFARLFAVSPHFLEALQQIVHIGDSVANDVQARAQMTSSAQSALNEFAKKNANPTP